MLKSCVPQGAGQLGSLSITQGPCGPSEGSVHDGPEFVPHLPDGPFEVLQGTPDRLVGVVGIEFVGEVIPESPPGVPTLAQSDDGLFDRSQLGRCGLSQRHSRLLVVVVDLNHEGLRTLACSTNEKSRLGNSPGGSKCSFV